MATQRALAVHLVLSVSRIRQLQYGGVIEKDASLDCARLAYIRWLRERISSKSNSDINNERARLVYHQANLAALEEETRRSKLLQLDAVLLITMKWNLWLMTWCMVHWMSLPLQNNSGYHH
jgi:hypothetical protein